MLNLESLRIFVTAAETENFSRAAQQLHLSQPSVSQHIQSLEQHLGIDLFERRGRHISLSSAGSAVLPMARSLLHASRQIEEVAVALKGEVSGHLTIGCSTASGKYVLPRLLAGYRAEHPHVRATVKVGSRVQVVEWLLTGEVNLGVTSDRIQRSGLHYRRFFEDEIVLIVPSDHPWARRSRLEPQELYEERFILREAGSGTQSALVEGLDQIGIDVDQLETVLVLDNSEAIVMAVEEKIGLAFVSRMTVERYGAKDRVKIVPVRGLQMMRLLYLVNTSQVPQPTTLGAFLHYVDQRLPFRTSSEGKVRVAVMAGSTNSMAEHLPGRMTDLTLERYADLGQAVCD